METIQECINGHGLHATLVLLPPLLCRRATIPLGIDDHQDVQFKYCAGDNVSVRSQDGSVCGSNTSGRGSTVIYDLKYLRITTR